MGAEARTGKRRRRGDGGRDIPKPDVRPISMAPEHALRADLVRFARLCWERRLLVAMDGNLSVRLADGSVLATRAGCHKGMLTDDDLVVLDAQGLALYFSRAPIPYWRDQPQNAGGTGTMGLPTQPHPLRHIGIYAYRAGFLRQFPKLAQAPIETTEALVQLRAMWHGYRIAVHVTLQPPGLGVDTPQDLDRVRRLITR